MHLFLLLIGSLFSFHIGLALDNLPVAEKVSSIKATIQPFRFYSNYNFDGEHASGANLWIWSTKDSHYIGLFSYHEGDIGYQGVTELESTKIDLKTGSVSFSTTKTSYGEKGQ